MDCIFPSLCDGSDQDGTTLITLHWCVLQDDRQRMSELLIDLAYNKGVRFTNEPCTTTNNYPGCALLSKGRT